MTYLVTGATGFIGAYVVHELLGAGEAVIAFDRSPRGTIEKIFGRGAKDIPVVVGDVADMASLLRVISDHRVNRIIHLAAELHIASRENPRLCLQSNVIGLHSVLEAARVTGVAKVVTASSTGVFGAAGSHSPGPIPNDGALIPRIDVYDASKVFGEHLVAHYVDQGLLDAVALRVGIVYGFGMLAGIGWRLMDELVMKPLRGEPGVVPFGDDVMNWTYVKDAAGAFLLASSSPYQGVAAYSVRGDLRSVRDAVAAAQRLLPLAAIRADRGRHGWEQDFDDSVFREHTGYAPAWRLEDGLRDTLEMART